MASAPDTTSFSDAIAVIQKYGLQVPKAVLERFQEGACGNIPDTPKPGDPVFKTVDNHIIANNQLLSEAAARKARELNLNTLVLSTGVEGEAKDIGRFFAAIAREMDRTGNPVKPPACILAAGETTVTVQGDGVGGRNQEMALAWAISMASRPPNRPSCFASVATDGTDGPTDAAGAIADGDTLARNPDARRYLDSNDSYHYFQPLKDLIITGPTNTNVMDVRLILVGSA